MPTSRVRPLSAAPSVRATLVTVPAVGLASLLVSCLARVKEASTLWVRVWRWTVAVASGWAWEVLAPRVTAQATAPPAARITSAASSGHRRHVLCLTGPAPW
jgi:hypothetical protein